MCLSLTVRAKAPPPLCVLGAISKVCLCILAGCARSKSNCTETKDFFDPAALQQFFLFIYLFIARQQSRIQVFIESTVHPRLNKSRPRWLCHFQEPTEVPPSPPPPPALCSDQKHQKHFQKYFHSAHVIAIQLFCICCLCVFTLGEHNNNSGQ